MYECTQRYQMQTNPERQARHTYTFKYQTTTRQCESFHRISPCTAPQRPQRLTRERLG